MSDATFYDVGSAIASRESLPFFVEEVQNSELFASAKKPTQIISWARQVQRR